MEEGTKTSRHVVLPVLVPRRVIETASAELEDGTQIEIVEDPHDSSRTQLAVFKNGEVHLADRFESENRVFVPIPRSTNLIRHVRLPRGVKPCGTVSSLLGETFALLSDCLDLANDDIALLAYFVLSTWVIEQLPIAPYVALVGLSRSGKSTAISLLSLLCRRALATSDITPAAYWRVCDQLTPTLLIDETATAGDRRALFHLLRTGTSRGAIALRKDQSFKTFGPKVISWIELPNDTALNSRCIVIPLHETRRTDLLRPTSPQISRAAEDLQKRFLWFRFEKSKSLTLPKIQGVDKLYSRSRDLYEALALAAGEDAKLCEWLIGRLQVQEESNRAPLSARQSAVLQSLFSLIHMAHEKRAYLSVGYLDALVNFKLRTAGENFQMSAREVGAVLTSLGFTERRRTNTGWVIRIGSKEEQQIHDLVAAYRPEFPDQLPEREDREGCELCKRLLVPDVLVT